jgi:sugar transferase (PEP-CTERM system associated)
MRQLFRIFIPAGVVGLIVSEVALLVLCYLAGMGLVGHFLNPTLDFSAFLFDEGGLGQIAVVVTCVVAGIYFQNLYAKVREHSTFVLLQQLSLAVGMAFLVQALFTYIRRPEWSLPRWGMIFGTILVLIAVPAWRLLYGRVILKAMGSQRVLFLGTSQVSQEIAAHLLERPELGMLPLGFVDDVAGGQFPFGELLGRIKDLTDVARSLKPDLVVVGMTERRRELPMSEMLHLRFSGVKFEDAAVTFEAAFGRISSQQLRPSRLIFSSDLGPRKGSLFWHSVYSIPCATLLLTLFAPVMLILAILVKVTSRGPIFHRQVRVGLNGSEFTLYKFRSMYVDAEARTGAVWAKRDDPRITMPGKWMRRLRLDELPQLFNVIRNEMGLVGPRPERPRFVKLLSEQIPYYNYRHCVRPGITGWAQINYKYGDTLEDAIMKLEYDLYYIKNLSLSLDMFIMFHTLKVMLFSETAQ